MEKSEITQHLVNLLNDRVTVTPNSYHFNHEPFDTTLMYIHLRENDSMNNQYFDNQYKFFISEIHNIRNFAKTPDTLEAAIKSNELQSIVLNRNRHNSILYNIKNKYNPQNIIIAIDEQLEEWQGIAEDANIGIKNISNAINKLKLNLLGFEDFDHFITDVTNLFESINNSKVDMTILQNKLKEIDIDDQNQNIQNYKNDIEIEIKEITNELFKEITNNERFINQKHTFNLSSFLDHYNYKETLTEINKQFNKIYQKIMDSRKCMPFSEAEGYLRTVLKPDGKKSASDFIIHKNVEDAVEFQLDVTVPSKIKTFIGFDDNSILIKDSQDNYIMVKDNNEAIKYVRELFDSFIDEKLTKRPFLAKYFKKILSNDYTSMVEAELTINTFFENEDILKNLKFNISNTNLSTFEEIDDHMNSIIKDYKVKKYAHSITSNKYNHLFNDESYAIIKEIYDLKIESNMLQTMIGKKLAAFKNPDDLNSALNNLLDGFNSFTIEQITINALNNKADIIHSEDNIIILEIKNFEQSKLLGSSSWCISRDKQYFNSYTAENCKQYFVYDFNKGSKDTKSMIGITLSEDGSYYAAHIKDDTSISIDNIKHLQLKIISKSIEKYPLLDESLKKEIALNENNKSIKKRLDI